MESIWVIAGATVVLVVGIAWVIHTRRMRGLLRERDAVAQRAQDLLRDRERSASEDRAVQDLILSSMEEGVLLFGPDERTRFANEALARHLGSTPTDVEGLLPLAIRQAVKRAGFTGAVMRSEAETGAPSRWLQASALPLGDDGSVLLVVQDVTEARRLESIRRDFVTNASHELKTPAASIQAAAETLRDAAADDPRAVKRFAEQLERESLRLSRIVNDLLDLSRLESGSDRQERVRLDTIASEEAERLRDDAREAKVSLSVEADGVASIPGSTRDLSLLVRNLIDNAIRYTPSEGAVRVEVAEESDAIVVRVADTGVGIPSRELPRIFERFYRVDRARSRETGGTGLGLAIVKHVAENHGGHVDVKSELGQGTTFTVVLPMV